VASGRVVLVSDTHFSRRAPQAQANWEAVLRYVEAAAPDAVIHIGDLSLDGAHEPEDLRYAREQLVGCPWPGTQFPATTTSATIHFLVRPAAQWWQPTGCRGGWMSSVPTTGR
jgi:3',5'-cyclic AMP phosphodiesterase CpdA